MDVINLGLIDYQEAYQKQLEFVQEVLEGSGDKLIVCSHPSVVTLGKKSTGDDLKGWQGQTYTIERGGQATYHGPGQVIIYPVINLKHYGQNLAGFLEALEHSMIRTLNHYKVEAKGNQERGKPDYTGVWVGQQKIASIGIAVKRWVTYHGLALNLYKDEQAFQGINPCGFSSDTMTSLEHLLGEKVDRKSFEEQLTNYLINAIADL